MWEHEQERSQQQSWESIYSTFRQRNIRALLSYLKVSYLVRVCACLSLPFWFGVRSIRGTVAPNIHLCVNILLYICITECSLAHSVYIADRLCFLPSSCLLPFAIFHFSFFFCLSLSFSLCICVRTLYTFSSTVSNMFFSKWFKCCVCYRLNSLFQIFKRKFVSENCSDYPFTACTMQAMIHVPHYIIFRTIECVERPNSHQFDMPLVNIYRYIRYIHWC